MYTEGVGLIIAVGQRRKLKAFEFAAYELCGNAVASERVATSFHLRCGKHTQVLANIVGVLCRERQGGKQYDKTKESVLHSLKSRKMKI